MCLPGWVSNVECNWLVVAGCGPILEDASEHALKRACGTLAPLSRQERVTRLEQPKTRDARTVDERGCAF